MEQFIIPVKTLLKSWDPLTCMAVVVAGAAISGLAIQYVVLLVVGRLEKRSEKFLAGLSFKEYIKGPVRFLAPLIAIRIAVAWFGEPEGFLFFKNALGLLIIGGVAWLLVRSASLAESIFLSFYKVDVEDNLEARKIHTQVKYVKRVLVIVILIVSAGTMLTMFDKVRQFGVGILTSAGIAGIVIGLAAQRSIANLLVGVQIAITQPIRLDDVVIVENEWGWIEEINSTYVVVRLWDLRRLIVPLTHFTEKPFQNWTRTSASLLGSVHIHVDYSAPVHEIRRELHRILLSSDLWDGKTWGLQATDTTERSMELRALMSAKNAPLAWDLRCEVREKLVAYLQKNFPESLPRIRAEIEGHGQSSNS